MIHNPFEVSATATGHGITSKIEWEHDLANNCVTGNVATTYLTEYTDNR
jgi:hypothetical protein